MEAQTHEEGSQSRCVIDRGVDRSDCIIKMHQNVVEDGRNESHDKEQPGGSAGGVSGHVQQFVEPI